MPIPTYQSFMLPLLRLAADGREHSLKEAVTHLASEFRLSDAERNEYLPSGKQRVFENRIRWARTYIGKAGLVSSPRRGYFAITKRGVSVLDEGLSSLSTAYLERFPEFVEFKTTASRETASGIAPEERSSSSDRTPHEALETAYDRLRSELADEILSVIKESEPSLFEELVVDLLVTMGYGGSRRDAGQAIGRRGDEGIDGIIKEDRLGLDIIYIQAKRWEGTIGRPEIQKFAGALDGQRAKKGIFITTSDFSREAAEYASRIDKKIILIDGPMLAGLMIDHDVGVTPVSRYEVKKLDADYFER